MKGFFLSGIPTEILEREITREDMAIIAMEHLIEWESLSPHLGLSRADEQVIQRTNGNYGMKKKECLELWKERKGNKATYGALITAAKSAKNRLLADKVKAMLQKKVKLKEKGDDVNGVRGKSRRKVHACMCSILWNSSHL